MNRNHPDFEALRQTVRTMRAQGARRQEASEYVCRKLLYELAETPNAKLVREITDWGSISDIQDDVRAFLASLKTSVEAVLPESGLPAPLLKIFSAGLAEMYAHTKGAVEAEYETRRQALEAERTAWLEREAAMTASLREANDREESLRELSARQTAQIDEVNREAAALKATIETLSAKLDQGQRELAETLRTVSTLRSDMLRKAEEHAQQLAHAETAAEARRQPLLVEIDSLRQQTKALERKLQEAIAASESATRSAAAAVSERKSLESQLVSKNDLLGAQAAQLEERAARLGELQDSLRSAHADREQAVARADAAEQREREAAAELLTLTREVLALRTTAGADVPDKPDNPRQASSRTRKRQGRGET